MEEEENKIKDRMFQKLLRQEIFKRLIKQAEIKENVIKHLYTFLNVRKNK